MTADKKRNRPAKNITWTEEVPIRRGKRAPENQLNEREEVSAKAKDAKSTEDLWGLFMTDQILDSIVKYTNEKIHSYLAHLHIKHAANIKEHLMKRPWVKTFDKVK